MRTSTDFLFLSVLTCLVAVPAVAKDKSHFMATGSAHPFAATSMITNAMRGGDEATLVKPDAERVAIKIAQDSLGKEFLLQAALTTFGEAPTFNGIKSRIVLFQKHRGKLYMLEASRGRTVTEELPTTLLLAEFPIIEEMDGFVEFDFNAGMKTAFVAQEWYASDQGGGEFKAGLVGYNARFSFLDAATVYENQIIIRQIAQLETPTDKEDTHPTVEIKYYLTLYAPDATFVPSKVKNPNVMGFFEVTPQLQSGGSSIVHASKFHPNKPITFALSANTPKEYRQAVKEGILYWNKAFGEEKMHVVDAPAGVVPPDFNLNIVQWVTFDEAPAAYADAQMDPRTGEILHAQIYLPSTFASQSKPQLRTLLARARVQDGGHVALGAKSMGLIGACVDAVVQFAGRTIGDACAFGHQCAVGR